jgi:hypothetical protein
MMLDRMNDDSDSDLTSVGHYEPWKSKGKGKDEGRMATNTGGVKDGEHDKVVERLLMKWIENEAPQVDVPPSNEKDEKTQAGPSSGPAQPKLTVEDWI